MKTQPNISENKVKDIYAYMYLLIYIYTYIIPENVSVTGTPIRSKEMRTWLMMVWLAASTDWWRQQGSCSLSKHAEFPPKLGIIVYWDPAIL